MSLEFWQKPSWNEKVFTHMCQNIQLTYTLGCQYTKKVFHGEYFIGWWWMPSITFQIYAFINMKPKNMLLLLINYDNGNMLMLKVTPHKESRMKKFHYHQISNINRTLVGNEIVDHSDVGGASPIGAAPTTSSFSTQHQASMDWANTTGRRDEKHLGVWVWCTLY